MTSPIHLSKDYLTSRSELRAAINRALERRRPPIGFILGLLSTIAIAGVILYIWFHQ